MTLAEFAAVLNAMVEQGYGDLSVVLTADDHAGDGDFIALDQHLEA